MPIPSLPWADPFHYAQAVSRVHDTYIFFHSSAATSYSGRYSYLAFDCVEEVSADTPDALEDKLSSDASALDNAWFGYLGYGMRHASETLSHGSPSHIQFETSWFGRFATIIQFDHERTSIQVFGKIPDLAFIPDDLDTNIPDVVSLESNMSKDGYLDHVDATLEQIRAGEFYQANITRKFYGTFASPPTPLAVFHSLCDVSPAPYSALIVRGRQSIVSSSPERFLHIDCSGRVEARPIKGTIAASSDEKENVKRQDTLRTSEKDRAENLMIVDLMRNDLSRGSQHQSVRVENLYEVQQFSAVHHMDSVIHAQKRPELSSLEFMMHCFPPGSMTGAPKIRAMEWCNAREKQSRGVYSGAIGWFGGDGSADFSVVIRTILIEGEKFEFQVGGGIVSDSEHSKEWEETIDKAKGICAALSININVLNDI